MTKTAIFENSRWRTAAIFKIALSPYLSRELSDFGQIWPTDTNFHSEHANLKKNRNFSNSNDVNHMTNIRLGLAIVPLCRGTGAPTLRLTQAPLAPSKFFDVCVTEKNSIIAVAPCLRPWS